MSIKSALGKLTVDGDLLQGIDESGFEHLPITLRHAVAAGELPPHHRDRGARGQGVESDA